MRKITLAAALVTCAMLIDGCSVIISAKGREGTETSFLLPGVERDVVVAKLGLPQTTEKNEEGLLVNTWVIRTGVKGSALWAAGHAAADVATLGLWEIVGTPASAVGNELADKRQLVTVTFDKEDRIQDVVLTPYQKPKPDPKDNPRSNEAGPPTGS